MNMITRIYRIIFATLGATAIVTEITTLLSQGTFNAGNFFSFFTILSNGAAVAVLAYFAFKKKPSERAQSVRTAATLYMIMTGIIFSLLLAGLTGVQLTAVPLNNTILHYIMPVAVALDWLVHTVKPTVFKLKSMLIWLSVPILYVGYSLVRGAIVGWYPYPFLNPSTSSYSAVAVTIVILALGVVVVVAAMRLYAQLRAKKA